MRTSDYDYDLPPARIAQTAAEPRDSSRLLVLPSEAGPPAHRVFRDLPDLLRAGDLLILNDTRVIPARLFGVREATGGKVECLLVRDRGGARWEAMVRSGGKPKPGERLRLAEGLLTVELLEKAHDGTWLAALDAHGRPLFEVLAEHGTMPLPPYIGRKDAAEQTHATDRERYQTVFAREPGAVAAPTAGLHFTDSLLAKLRALGVAIAHVTLHVGPGTFRPVTVDDPREHPMHAEVYAMPEATRDAIVATRAAGGRVIACGTTAVRTVETVAGGAPLAGATELFLYPGTPIRWVDGLITNFHLPRSTLLMLVSAFCGRERLLAAYAEALREGYRFYSYGDAMLVL